MSKTGCAQKKNLIKEELQKRFTKKGFKPFYKWWWREIYYTFWDAKNRFFYGYSDRDWFNWDYEFAARNIELFKQFRDHNHSLMGKYPFHLRQYYKDGYESFTDEQQFAFFNTLIDCLEDMKDDGEHCARKLYGKDLYKCSKEEAEEVFKVRRESIELFFDTVRDRFDDFWD